MRLRPTKLRTALAEVVVVISRTGRIGSASHFKNVALRGAQLARETIQLAEYAAALKYEDLPPAVVQRAKDCIADTVAVILFGYDLPWSRIIVDYATQRGGGGSFGNPRSSAPLQRVHWLITRSG